MFHVLPSFCDLANGTISNALVSFNSTRIISIELLSEDVFHGKTQQFIDVFIQSTKKLFSYHLDSIRTTTEANFIMAGFNTNTVSAFLGSYPSFDLNIFDISYDYCDCSASAECVSKAIIYSYNGTLFTRIYTIPGFFIGCYMEEAVRKSSLQCYFNQSCIDTFKFYLNFSQSFDTKPLDPHMISTHNITSSVDDLVKNLMVEQWVWNDSFKIYYQKCRPSSCSYTLSIKTPLIIIITTLIGLFGGLVKILRIVVPFVIQFARRRKHLQEPQPNSQIRIADIPGRAKNALQNLNLFQSTKLLENDDNGYQLRNELISTRLFICLLFISMVILLIYTSQVQVTHTITVNTPLLEVYSSLYEKYAETLTCPCTNIAIEQQEFISLIPTFHQICDSDFVDPRWPMGIQNTMQLFDYIYNRDFRMRGYSLFQALVSICALAKVSIGNALIDFKSTTFISKNLLSEKTFAAQMNAVLICILPL
ncbi:unnamed protein product [Rotaria sp. Silwood1]|nr:unnamed protein product [Rotaria sp. Silwood1]